MSFYQNFDKDSEGREFIRVRGIRLGDNITTVENLALKGYKFKKRANGHLLKYQWTYYRGLDAFQNIAESIRKLGMADRREDSLRLAQSFELTGQDYDSQMPWDIKTLEDSKKVSERTFLCIMKI